ncbi:MAG: cation-translocating P-type ATPase [Clostridiales bacterium]|nr:cation-translocating P-type ATPase [Clostridiales bacterium]
MADIEQGLSSSQVEERITHGWTNIPTNVNKKTTASIVRDNLCTYFNLIFLLLAVLLCAVGSFRNLTFLPVILINTLIGVIQGIRAKNTLEKMNMLGAPQLDVIRDGMIQSVPSEQLVRDDIVILRAGNQICADAQVIAGEIQVNESLLTGEADEVVKHKDDELISGSFVVSGECHARLTRVGSDSYISGLTAEAKQMPAGEQSKMMRSLNALLRFAGIALIPIGMILFCQSYGVNHETVSKSVTSTVAAIIGMIPEGLYLLTSIALAVSAIRLANKRVLLHNMKCIETLARVDVLCVDKTGTITENKMEVKRMVPTRHYVPEQMPELSRLIGDFAHSMSNDNSTMQAVKAYFQDGTGKAPVSVTPFSSVVKYSAVTFETGTFVLGAPEFVLREEFQNYKEELDSYVSSGYRVLVFASYDGKAAGQPLTGEATPLGYVLLSNAIRETAPDTFAYFAEQGVEIKVISGDNPLAVSEAAKAAQIMGAEKYIDASTLKTDSELEDAINDYVVFGRVTPEQKRQFIQTLKHQGRTVAMTGDGVNDVLALKDADCSIAMATGSDAAAHAAQIVLLDSDFACMPAVVLEGRRVVNNIQCSASLFLVKNIFSFLLALFSAITAITYPLEPTQISLVSLFTIGVPGFFLALRENRERISGKFMQTILLKALPAGLTDLIAVSGVVIFGQVFGIDTTEISTVATILLAIVGFLLLYRIGRPSNILQWGLLLFSVLGFAACCICIPSFFAISSLSAKGLLVLIVFSVAVEPVFRYSSACMEGLQKYCSEHMDTKNTRSGKIRRFHLALDDSTTR